MRINSLLGSELEHTMARVAESSIMPTVDLCAFRSELADTFTFEKPLPLDWLLQWTIDRMEHGIVQMTHRRYFGLFNPAPSFPAQCADRIISAFNPQLASSASSPVPVELEKHVIRAVARRAGLTGVATGHFGNGGSEANYTALLCALTAAHPAFAAKGARAFSGSPVFYASRECHIAWLKIAHQAGIGRNALRLVGTDGHGRMDPKALIDAIDRDRANGAIPVMLVATAGTTGGGMIDPLAACADIAASQGLWYHVDAAWVWCRDRI
jgi:aromatic-L-amino-acid decarboxylase